MVSFGFMLSRIFVEGKMLGEVVCFRKGGRSYGRQYFPCYYEQCRGKSKDRNFRWKERSLELVSKIIK